MPAATPAPQGPASSNESPTSVTIPPPPGLGDPDATQLAALERQARVLEEKLATSTLEHQAQMAEVRKHVAKAAEGTKVQVQSLGEEVQQMRCDLEENQRMILSEVSKSFENMGQSIMQQLAAIIQPQLLNQVSHEQRQLRPAPALVNLDQVREEAQMVQASPLPDAPISIPSDSELDEPS